MTAVRRDRARKAGVLAASIAGHVAVFALIGLNTPEVRERIFEDEDPAMVVDLFRPPPPPRAPRPDVRRAPAPQPSPARPREVAVPRAAPVLPLPMAPVPRATPAPAPTPARGSGSGGAVAGPGAGQPGGDLRGALRGSTVGCANRGAVGLNRREAEACDEKLGAGAKDAPFIEPPIDPTKRAGYDRRAAKLRRDREWRERAPPIGIDPRAGPGEITGLDK